MRKFLLASVAALGTGGLIGTAVAQTPVVGAPTQGQQAFPPAGSPPAGANNNNNYQAAQLPGAVANPTPGTIVIHVNGRVTSQLQGEWGSLTAHLHAATADRRDACAPSSATTAPVRKVAPLALDNYVRLYFGADAMATNGLRYGAAIELRENFTGPSQQQQQFRRQRLHSALRRCTCGAPSPTSPASSGASSASARPTASSASSTTA